MRIIGSLGIDRSAVLRAFGKKDTGLEFEPTSLAVSRDENTTADCFLVMRNREAPFAQTVPSFFPNALSLLACTAALCGWTVAVTHHLTLETLALFLALPVSWVMIGGTALRALRFPRSMVLALVLGSLLYALLVLALRTCCPLSLRIVTWLVLAGSLGVGKMARMGPVSEPSPGDYLVVLFCLLAATLWSQDVLFGAIDRQGDDLVYHPWADYFTHAKCTAMLANGPPLLRCDDYELSGHRPMFYHYASYIYPATLTAFGNCSAYESLLAVWTPLGTALAGLAAYAVAAACWGPRAGWLAVLFLFGIPDASTYGFRNGYFGYWWLQQVAPAGNYGVACAALALIFLVCGSQAVRLRWLIAGFGLTGACLLFKAHVFVALLPLAGLAVILCLPRLSLRGRVGLALLLAAAPLGGLLFASQLGLFPPLAFDGIASTEWFRESIVPFVPDPFLRGLVTFEQGQTTYCHPLRAGLALTGLAFGFWPVLYLGPLVWAARRGRLDRRCWIPLAGTLVYGFLIFGLAKNEVGGNPDEFCHRPFVLAYFLWAVFTGGLLGHLTMPEWTARTPFAVRWLAVPCFLVAPLLLGHRVQHPDNRMADKFTDCRVPRGLWDCARFLRSQKPATATILDSTFDPDLVVGGLSEHPSYLSRVDEWVATSPAYRRSNYREMLRLVSDLVHAPTLEQLQRAAASAHIRWLVARPNFQPTWPLRPAFESAGYRVFDLATVGSGAFP